MAIKLYTEPLMVLCDYLFLIDRKHKILEFWFPVIIGAICGIYAFINNVDTYAIVVHVQSIITTLLGFSLAAMAIFIAGGDKCEQAKTHMTNYAIRNKCCSLYDLMILNYSYQVIVELLLSIAYIIGHCLPNWLPWYLATIMNIVYIIIALSVCLSILRSVTDLYWIFIKKS